MAVVLTLVQTKQIIYINETVQKHSTNNTIHSKYKYTHYRNTHTVDRNVPGITEHTHTRNNTLQNNLKQPQYKCDPVPSV